MSAVLDYTRANIAELERVAAQLDPVVLDQLVDTIVTAPRVFFTGIGRSGLAARAIAMRLMHVGLTAHVVGEVSTPGIARGDVLIAVTATGRGAILQQAQTASARGASVAAISTIADGALADLAAPLVVLPIRTRIETAQHAGSLFEQSVLVIGDAICRVIQERLGVPSSELDRRHANL